MMYDPACGSGRFILKTAKHNRDMYFCGADLDETCCKMTLFNMLINTLHGEVAHMNTLSNEFFNGYKVRSVLKDGYHYPYFIEFDDPEQSVIWTRPEKSAKAPQYIQGDLFEGMK